MAANQQLGKAELNSNEILQAEFGCIAQCAFQANEDRARVSNYYLVTVAAAVGALVSGKLEGPSFLSPAVVLGCFA
jgi:hypothetical protein